MESLIGKILLCGKYLTYGYSVFLKKVIVVLYQFGLTYCGKKLTAGHALILEVGKRSPARCHGTR